MKILYIDQYFSNREGISGTRAYEFARRFVAQGHTVTVLACTSRYSVLGAAPQREWFRRVVMDGINVVSIRVRYAQQMSGFGRLRAFVAFLLWATVAGVFAARHDVIFASSTPLTVGVPALLINRLRGTPFVFEVRDLWPRAPIELGYLKHPVAQWVARFAERLFYRTAEKIVALSPGMVQGVMDAGAPADKIVMIPNSCDFDLFADAPARDVRSPLGIPPEARLVIHAGNLGPSNDGDWLLDWMASLQAVGHGHVWLLLLGEGSERSRLEARAQAEGLSHVRFAGPVSRQATAAYLQAADAGIVSFADRPVLQTNSPNKFFDYLAGGLPVFVNTDGWTAELLRETGAGLALPRNVSVAAEAAASLLADPARLSPMRDQARMLAQRFERGKLAAELLDVLRDASSRQVRSVEGAAKRLTDLLLAGLAVAVCSPILLGLAVAIALDTPGGVFFRQERIGRHGRSFRLWKFRTMVRGAADVGDGLNVGEQDARITRVGRFLRDWSLDELPQLFNMLAGTMSIVGPRPALREHVAVYNDEQKQRLRLRPGLTGLAQISGRNALTWDAKLACDVRYVRTWSWWGDVKIILKTIPVVLRREGLYEADAGKTDRFNRFDNGDDNRPDA